MSRESKVESAEINRELKRMQQGYESEQQFYDSMQSQLGMSEQEIKEDVSNKLLLEKLATASIHITDTQVDTYIKTHADEFKQETEYNILQIIVSTKEQATKVIAELAKGESFATLARDRSWMMQPITPVVIWVGLKVTIHLWRRLSWKRRNC